MKTRLFVILLLLTTMNGAFAQWTKQNSGTKNKLSDIAFLGPTLGYAVGANGTVLKTVNGGAEWIALPSPDQVDITSVTIVDSVSVFVTTSNARSAAAVYGSTDGGRTWKNLLTDSRSFYVSKTKGNKLFSISSKIYESDDNGVSWHPQANLNSTSIYNHVSFADKKHGIVAGNVSGFLTYSAQFLRTKDGGKNWYSSNPFEFVNANACTALDELNADSVFMFTNFYKGFAPGDSSQLILLTNFKLRQPVADSEWNFKSKIVGANFNDRIYDCRFFEGGTAYAAGERGIIYSSANYGNRWQKEFEGTAAIHSIHMLSENNGYAAGDSGLILKRDRSTLAATRLPQQVANLKTYPNPANDHTMVSFIIDRALTVYIQVMDEQGNIAFEQAGKLYNKGTQQISIPVTNWQRGVYHVSILSNGKAIATGKLLVVH